MKLQASPGWVIVQRAEPATSEGGIILTGKPAKVDRGQVISADDPAGRIACGEIVRFEGGKTFDHAGYTLLAVKIEDIIAREVPQ